MKSDNADHVANKTWLVEYVKSFPEGREAVRIKGGRHLIPGLLPAASTKPPSTSQCELAPTSFSKPSLLMGLLEESITASAVQKDRENHISCEGLTM